MEWIIIGVVALLFIIVIAIYNKLVKLKTSVEEAFSTMDVYLKKRYDLIPNLVETVKGYAKHEKETLEEVIKMRNSAYNASGVESKISADNNLSGSLSKLFAIAEGYPDLKANSNFIELQNTLKSVENDIANSRKYYNGVVKNYNIKIQTVPSNIIAGMFGFLKMPMYELKNEVERENVEVKF